MSREIIITVTRKHCKWDYFSGTGAGGQHRNKHRNCVRVHHVPSGARGTCQDFREKAKNEQLAFKRMANTDKMQHWLRIESAKKTGDVEKIESAVAWNLRPDNVIIEAQQDGLWKKIT